MMLTHCKMAETFKTKAKIGIESIEIKAAQQ
jgi:hypothetical protein